MEVTNKHAKHFDDKTHLTVAHNCSQWLTNKHRQSAMRTIYTHYTVRVRAHKHARIHHTSEAATNITNV